MNQQIKKSSKTPGPIEQRRRALDRKRAALLSLDPEEALERILQDPEALPLTHAFPPEDLYLLVHEIGPDDSLPLIALSSDRQREFFLDQAVWVRDRFDPDATTRWLSLLMAADPRRVIPWLVREKQDLLKFYLFTNVDIQVRAHDQDPGDFGDGYFSLDGVYYFRIFQDPATDTTPAGDRREDARVRLIHQLLEKIADHDHHFFQALAVEIRNLIPAETEEEAYRLRNVRMSEKGFFPFEEAVGLYQRITRPDFENEAGRRAARRADTDDRLPVPYYPLESLAEDNLFVRTLKYLETLGAVSDYQAEFAALCNQLIAADQVAVDQREKLVLVVQKAARYISVGLERLVPSEHRPDFQRAAIARAADWMRQYPLVRIFRFGFSAVLEVKWAAERWVRESWFGDRGLPLSFWGETWMGALGGLLVQKPVYFDNFRSGRTMYREFCTLDEIEQSREILETIIEFDRLFHKMALSLTGERPVHLTYRNFLLTHWARHALELPASLAPIPLDLFRPFFDKLFGDSPAADGSARTIPMERREAFLRYLSQTSQLPIQEISRRLGNALESLFSELVSEYGHVAGRDLDPRYIPHFLLSA